MSWKYPWYIDKDLKGFELCISDDTLMRSSTFLSKWQDKMAERFLWTDEAHGQEPIKSSVKSQTNSTNQNLCKNNGKPQVAHSKIYKVLN
jgi:hypothetical protein